MCCVCLWLLLLLLCSDPLLPSIDSTPAHISAVGQEYEHGQGEEDDTGQQKAEHRRGVHVGRIEDVILRQQEVIDQDGRSVRRRARLLDDDLLVLNLRGETGKMEWRRFR